MTSSTLHRAQETIVRGALTLVGGAVALQPLPLVLDKLTFLVDAASAVVEPQGIQRDDRPRGQATGLECVDAVGGREQPAGHRGEDAERQQHRRHQA
jgi:hypothetical protein